jgi:transposase
MSITPVYLESKKLDYHYYAGLPDMFGWIVEIVLRPLEKKGFVVLPKRWVVERTNIWMAQLVSALEQRL